MQPRAYSSAWGGLDRFLPMTSFATRLALVSVSAFSLSWIGVASASSQRPTSAPDEAEGLSDTAFELDSRANDRIADGCRLVLGRVVKGSIPGASAALVLPDGKLVATVAGLASMDTREPLATDHRMLAGSTGKSLVAAAVLQLAQEGQFELNARAAALFEPIPDWLRALPNGEEFTVRHLLRHESGLPRYVFKPDFVGTLASEPERRWQPAELLAFVAEDRPLFAPGEGWAYADTNYIVLGMLIEKLTGSSYYEYARKSFIEPLRLDQTVATDAGKIPRMAQGHVVAGRAMRIPDRTLADGTFTYNVQFEWCGGGWASTPGDLARWAARFYGGEALEQDYSQELLEGVLAEGLGPGARYGVGAILRDTPAGRFVGHDGFMPGYLTTLAWFPDHGIAAALQINSDDSVAVGRPLALVLADLVEVAARELAK